jgi:uncharacterized peroxidase-related enzyme
VRALEELTKTNQNNNPERIKTMSRINPINQENANPKALEIVTAVKKALGIVPNMVATMAQSPAVATAYVGFSHALSQGSLSARSRERLALVVAEENSCDYCLAAHTFLAGKAGLGEQEILDNRRGASDEPKVAAALAFARKLVRNRGQVGDADVAALREHGFTEGEVAEIIANVALYVFTNYFNIAAGVEIDFPKAPALTA